MPKLASFRVKLVNFLSEKGSFSFLLRSLQFGSNRLIDNPGNQVRNVGPTTESSTGGYFNVANRTSQDDYLMMFRSLNFSVKYYYTPYTVSRLTSNFR